MDLELESTLDNSNNKTNNPFVINNSNQKDVSVTTNAGSLFDDILNKHQNGTNEDASPDLFYNNDNNIAPPNTNGKRASSFDDYNEYEDEEDRSEDFGPETDVDAVDDAQAHHVTISPTLIAAKQLAEGIVNNNPFGDDESKSQPYAESDQDDDDISDELIIQKDVNEDGTYAIVTNEFDEKCYETRNTHDNSATPPIGAVLDNSGCVATDNVAESGDDSDDEEWSYLRGDKNNTIENCQDNHIISDDNIITDDDMSQLNPNAAEFVPVSPVRTAHDITPLTPQNCKNLRDEDSLIAQSPQHPTPMAPTVPNSVESFICEIRERPGENEDDFNTTPETNIDDEINGHPIIDHQQNSSHSRLETILNGKNVDEIEFHPKLNSGYLANGSIIPGGGDIINESLNVSESLSTRAVYGDDTKNYAASDFTDDTNISDIKQDPMSMSFYQEKDAEGNDLGTNPFDLNAVQMIPDDLDEFIGEEKQNNIETDENIEDGDENIEETMNFIGKVDAAMKSKALDFEEKEQESPMEDKFHNEFESHEKTEELRSPIPDNDAVLQEQALNFDEQTVPESAVADECLLASNPLETQDDHLEVSPLPKSPSPVPEISVTPDINDVNVDDQHESEPVTASPLPDFEVEAPDVELTAELLSSKSPDVGFSDVISKSPLNVVSPGEELISKSPEIDSTAEIDSKSPDVISPAEEVLAKSPYALQSPVPEHQNVASPSPIPDDRIESPEEAMEAESTVEVTSPVPEKETNEEKETNLEKDAFDAHEIEDFAHEEAQFIQEAVQLSEPPVKSPVPELAVNEASEAVEEHLEPSPDVELLTASPVESPVPAKSPEPSMISPIPEPEIVASPIPEPEIVASPIPEPEIVASPIHEPEIVASPISDHAAPQALSPEPNCLSPVCSPSPAPNVQEVEDIPTHVEFEHHEPVSNIPEVCDNVPEEREILSSPAEQTVNEVVLETLNFDTFARPPVQQTLHLEEATNLETQNAFSPDEFDKEIKSTETPPPTPALNLVEAALISTSPEPNKLVEAVEKISEEQNVINEVEAAVIAGTAVVGAAAAVTAAVSSSAKSPKPEKKTTKPTISSVKASPTKKPSAPAAKTTPSKPLTSVSKSSTIPSKSLTSPRVPLAAKPSPRSASTTAASKLTPKKPLTNGEVKPATKTSTSASAASKPTSIAAKSTTTTRLGSAPTKTSPTSTRPPISRPTSARPSAPATKPTTTAASKPRTALTASSKPLTNGVSPKSATTTKSTLAAKPTSTLTSSKTSTTTARSLTKPSTTSSTTNSLSSARPTAPRVSSLTAKKSPLVEKTQKDTTNKQLSATRTTQSTLTTVKRTTNVLKSKTATNAGTTNSTSSTVIKKTETKSPLLNKISNNATSKVGSRPTTTTSSTLNSNNKPSTVTRTSTLNKKLPGVTRTTITKTQTSSQDRSASTPIEQNQTVTLVHEITNPSPEIEEFIQHIYATELGVNADSMQFLNSRETLIRIHAEFQMKCPQRYFFNLRVPFSSQNALNTSLDDKTVQTDFACHGDNNYNSQSSTILKAYEVVEKRKEQDELKLYQEIIRDCELFLESLNKPTSKNSLDEFHRELTVDNISYFNYKQ